MSPEDALKGMTLPDGFQVTLFAAEPDVRQPIAMATDDRGRLWVAENYTYAEGAVNFDARMRDRVVILEDVDGNGSFDKRTVFWDQGRRLTSVEIGHGGVWVLDAPNLLFIRDADKDDVPDGEPVVMLNGWDDNAARHTIVNGLRWGPDGWLYGRNGIMAISSVGVPGATPDQRLPLELAERAAHSATDPEIHQFLLTKFHSDESEQKRLRRLWALHVTGGTTSELLVSCLDDKSEHVRCWAIRFLTEDGNLSPSVLAKFQAMAQSDDSGLVLTWLASSLQRLRYEDRWPIALALGSRKEYANDRVLPLMVWYGIEPAVLANPD